MRGGVALVIEQDNLSTNACATIDEDGSRKVKSHLLRFVGFDGRYGKDEGI